MDNEKEYYQINEALFPKIGRVIIFPKDYTKQDYNGIAAILHAGVQTVCRGSCKNCKFERSCNDAMTVASYVAKMAHYSEK